MKEYLQIRNNRGITLPPDICRAAKLQEGDLLEAAVEEDGSICLVPKGAGIRKLGEQSQLKDMIGHQNRNKEPKNKAGSLTCLSAVDALICSNLQQSEGRYRAVLCRHYQKLGTLLIMANFSQAYGHRLLYNNCMAIPVLDVSPDKLDQYRRTAARREKVRAAKIKPRMDKAWKIARKAAKVLREQYHAERVAVFGSLLHESRFTEWSDVDIAAWGIAPDQTFRAIGIVMDLDPSFEINLVDVNTCTPSLLKAIEKEAVDL